jgi:hypothetical protein
MIVSFRSETYGQDEYVVCPHEPATVADLRDRMLNRAKVAGGSYAFCLIDDLHMAIFVRSLDLKADYETYFAKEYSSFAEYLRRRRRFPAAIVSKLSQAFAASAGMYHFRRGYSFLDGEYGLDFLMRLLEDSSAAEERT